MNPHQQQLPAADPAVLARYESDKRAWDEAIRAYQGPDPLDIWFNFICWLEQHKMLDKEGGFRKILEQCLSNFENYENYKQDVRMVKLWMKFIDMQANPLNLYQFLYKKNVGTQCACFYIGWAHYYDAANAFKQAESIFNLGIQVKAQPMEELQEAQNKFRLSIAQRMLYNDASSKKRSANTLVEQRQQITSLSPPQKKLKSDSGEYYPQPAQQQTQQQQPQPQPQAAQIAQAQPQQHQSQPQPQPQPQSHYNQQNYYQNQQQVAQQSTVQAAAPVASPAPANPTTEHYYQQDKQNAAYYQNSSQQHHYPQQTQQTMVQQQVQVPVQQQQQQMHQSQHPVQRQVQPQPQQPHHQMQAQHQAPVVATQNPTPAAQAMPPPPPQVRPQQPAIQVQPVVATPQPQPEPPKPQPAPAPQPIHKSVIIENYGLTMENDSLIECNLNNSAYVISSSLNYVYDDPNLTGYSLGVEDPAPPEEEKVPDPEPSATRLPVGFAREARSNHERWDVPLCLEEPYDPNRVCRYPKGHVYPDLHTGQPTLEFSPEEIRARKWYRRKEELEEQAKQKQQQLEVERQRQERQRQMQLQYQQQQAQQAAAAAQQQAQQQAQQAGYGHHQQQQMIPQQQRGYQQANQRLPQSNKHLPHNRQQTIIITSNNTHSKRNSSSSSNITNRSSIRQFNLFNIHLPPLIPYNIRRCTTTTEAITDHRTDSNNNNSSNNRTNTSLRPRFISNRLDHMHSTLSNSPSSSTRHTMVNSSSSNNNNTMVPIATATKHMHHHPGQQQPAVPPQSYAPHPAPRPQTPVQQPQQQQQQQPPYHHQPPGQPAMPGRPMQRPPQPYAQPAPVPVAVPTTSAAPSQHLQRTTSVPQQPQQMQKPPQPQQQQPQPPPTQAKPPPAARASASSRFSNCDDFEEQIEASTIRFSTSSENGASKNKTITIKFKKEKTTYSAPSPVPGAAPSGGSLLPPAAAASSANDASKKLKKVLPGTPSTPVSRAPPPPPQGVSGGVSKEKSKNSSKKSSKGVAKSGAGKKYDPDATVVPANRTDANLLLSLSGDPEDSSQSYASSVGGTKKKPKKKVRYIEEGEVFDDEYLDSDEDEYDDSDEDDDEDLEENDSSYQSNSEFNTSFSNISFAGDNSNGAFNFGGSSCSTPMRHTQTSGGISKTSTPIGSFRYLKKHESNLSLGQNEDSMSSTVVENSYFQTEHDEEAKRRRKEKALAIIETHLAKPFLDPFSSELCKAFLTKIDFPSRENTDDYKVTNNNLPKMIKSQMCSLAGRTYNVEKEVGRGSYGSVFRALNTGTGAVVAIKYQKPANTWELYICTEVRKRIKNPDILPGFMDICSAVIAPNASVLVSEFSQYGSLLDINNKIRTATTKVMHESLVMHFSSQILSIVEHLHGCNIIHADIKPDNFLLMQIPTVESDIPTLRLIDFGCAIDMNFFEKKRQFKKVIQTDGFTCIEMQEGRPWSFQTDLFCVAGTIHVMLFGEYMQLTKKYDQDWDIKQKLPRYLKKHVWTEVFQKLLNIKDINHMPKLSALKELIDGEVFNMESELMKHIRTLSNLLKRR
ncbi:hypothetical protein quinque_001778 [Culex quinquefasciatus]